MLKNWLESGSRLSVLLESSAGKSRRVHIFHKTEGKGPWLTLLHGFPTSSWDWSRITPALKQNLRLLLFDFLGFGYSDKPARHKYSISEQADITEVLWQRHDVRATSIVAHDYGDTVALELLSRQRDGMLSAQIKQIVMLNGGVYIDYQRPLLIQRLLAKPVLGAVLSRLLTEKMFKQRFASIFSESHPVSEADLEQFWRAVSSAGGVKRTHRIIRYLAERRKFKTRWEETLEKTEVPVHFIWGLADPVSGSNISEQIKRRLPRRNLLELPDVGHYPQWEVADLVAEAIRKALVEFP